MDAAIKEDNPNWCEATTGTSVGEYWKAMKTDIEMKHTGALGIVE